MEAGKMLGYIKDILQNMPANSLSLTTHKLDVYDEKLAKVQFIEHLEALFNDNNSEAPALREMPTAYDNIRLGHPVSCILEWAIANFNGLKSVSINF